MENTVMKKQLSKVEEQHFAGSVLTDGSSVISHEEWKISGPRTGDEMENQNTKSIASERQYIDFVYSVFNFCYSMITGTVENKNEY